MTNLRQQQSHLSEGKCLYSVGWTHRQLIVFWSYKELNIKYFKFFLGLLKHTYIYKNIHKYIHNYGLYFIVEKLSLYFYKYTSYLGPLKYLQYLSEEWHVLQSLVTLNFHLSFQEWLQNLVKWFSQKSKI